MKQLNKAHSDNGRGKKTELVGCPQLANIGVSELVNGWEMLAYRIPVNVNSWRSPVLYEVRAVALGMFG